MPIRNVVVATLLTGLVFFGYIRWVVPLVEGQSADQVPEIDLLGSLRVEQPGQWLALFPQEAWQRDPQRRNMIEADGNIVLFRDYHSQDDGSLRVAGLTLLLFDSEEPTAAPGIANATGLPTPSVLAAPASNAPIVGHTSAAVAKFPLVVEAFEDAILSFDAQTAEGLNRYGDLKRVEFLGRAKFWRMGETPADSFVIDTQQLQINGHQATTAAAVHFQFGESKGNATGLELTFDNSDSLQAQNANVTKIQGLRHLRLGRIDQLNLVTDDQRSLDLTCRGPAEFHFRRSLAKFTDDVRVLDRDSGHWSMGNVMVVQFQPPTADSEKPTRPPGLTTQLAPQALWFYGTPASVLNPDSALQLAAAVLHYDVTKGEFTAGPLPNTGVEPWMMEATTAADRSAWSQVEFQRGGFQLRTPHLRYLQAKPQANSQANSQSNPQSETPQSDSPLTDESWPASERSVTPADKPPGGSLGLLGGGELEAAGPGVLWHEGPAGKPPIEVQWQDRLTVTPDIENPAQWLITVRGETLTCLDAETCFQADDVYLWLQPTPVVGASAAVGMTEKWQPDLLMARGNVRFQDERLRASVGETRIYFPTQGDAAAAQDDWVATPRGDIALVSATDPAPSGASTPPRDSAGLAMARATASPTRLPPLSRRPTVGPPATRAERGTDVTAATMILQMVSVVESRAIAAASTSPIATGTAYRVETIDLDGGVVIEEAQWSGKGIHPLRTGGDSTALDPNTPDTEFSPRYRLLGQRVIGHAAASWAAQQAGATDAWNSTDPSNPQRSNQLDASGASSQQPLTDAFVWAIQGPETRPARVLTPDAELAAVELHFDQARQLTWTNHAGVVQFDISTEIKPNDPAAPVPTPATGDGELSSGRGSATWQAGMKFNGRDLLLDGQVKLDIDRPTVGGQQERLQAHAARLTMELQQPVRLDGLSDEQRGAPSQRVAARRLRLYAKTEPNNPATDSPVRVYQQRRDATQTLLAQEVIWAQEVELRLDQDQFQVSGPGTVWSLRPSSSSATVPAAAGPVATDPARPALTFLKVQFQREMNGHWGKGQVDLQGPVVALYGKTNDWQIMDNETRLIDPLKITSNQMTLNRWQPTPNAPFELEWEAAGRVHVLGEDFEGIAQQINYAQQQDLLTLRGDGRGPAKFWQIATTNGQRNHLAAQKIWYRPQHEDFYFEGFQEGNLNFFSGRRGPTPPDAEQP